MASASAAERSQSNEALRHRRGEQVVLTFSGQVRLVDGSLCHRRLTALGTVRHRRGEQVVLTFSGQVRLVLGDCLGVCCLWYAQHTFSGQVRAKAGCLCCMCVHQRCRLGCAAMQRWQGRAECGRVR
jgi:hypothetical protein